MVLTAADTCILQATFCKQANDREVHSSVFEDTRLHTKAQKRTRRFPAEIQYASRAMTNFSVLSLASSIQQVEAATRSAAASYSLNKINKAVQVDKEILK